MSDEEQRLRDIQRQYLDFLDDANNGETQVDAVKEMMKQKSNRLVLNLNAIRRALPDRARDLLRDSVQEILALQRALKELVGSLDSEYAQAHLEFHVGFEGSFGPYHLSPRTLTAGHLNHMVCLEGIVTKCSLIKPKINKSVHYCPATQKSTERTYSDLTSLDAFPSSAAYPTQDEDGNPLQTEFGLSTYR